MTTHESLPHGSWRLRPLWISLLVFMTAELLVSACATDAADKPLGRRFAFDHPAPVPTKNFERIEFLDTIIAMILWYQA